MINVGVRASSHEIKARWAYNELASPRFGRSYAGVGPRHIHDMAAARNPFAAITAADQNELVKMLEKGRGPEVAATIDASPHYRCEAWSKGQLCQSFALPAFNPPAKVKPIPYYDFYIGTPNTGPGGTAESSDPRVIAGAIPPGTPFQEFHEPIIVSGSPGNYLLLEGYLRSIIFMRAAHASQRLLAWLPFTPAPRLRPSKAES